jgi:hypothetical protein
MPRFVVHLVASAQHRPQWVVFDTVLGAPVGAPFVGLDAPHRAEVMALWHEAGLGPVEVPLPPPTVIFPGCG